MGQIVELRRTGYAAEERNARIETATLLAAILRRKVMMPVDRNRILLEFKTGAEARECQRLLDELGQKRKRTRR